MLLPDKRSDSTMSVVSFLRSDWDVYLYSHHDIIQGFYIYTSLNRLVEYVSRYIYIYTNHYYLRRLYADYITVSFNLQFKEFKLHSFLLNIIISESRKKLR